MLPYGRPLLLLALLLTLGYMGYYVWSKEHILTEGRLVLLELAPVDPRSLLQGNYMRLGYRMDRDLLRDEVPARGYLVVTLDANGVGTFSHFADSPVVADRSELALAFVRRRAGAQRNGRINIGADSYFIEEGSGREFATAKYGGLRVGKTGETVLAGLYDGERRLISDK